MRLYSVAACRAYQQRPWGHDRPGKAVDRRRRL